MWLSRVWLICISFVMPSAAVPATPSPMSLQQNVLAFMQDAERRDSGRLRSYSNAIGDQMVALEEDPSG